MASSEDDILQNEDKLWEKLAEHQQKQYANYFEKDSMDVCSFSVLKTRLAVGMFGLPEKLLDDDKNDEEDEGLTYKLYSKKQQKVINKVAECILENQKNRDENKILIGLILVLGISKSKQKIRFQECIFKVPSKTGYKYIDKNCRVYDSWIHFLETNTFPKARICCPCHGEYKSTEENFFVEYHDTPKCHIKNDILFGFDIATNITGVAAAAVGTASLFVPMVGPVIFTACAVSAASALYGAGRSIEHLVDRGKHNQTLSFLDTQARSAWLGATVPIIGIAATGATAVAAVAKISKLGVTISQSARTAINVTNGINCAAHGAIFIHDVYGIIESKMNDEKITKLQIFQCIASALFFANAVLCTYQASMLLQYQGVSGENERVYSKLSLPTYKENGVNIRPTNFVVNANITPMISLFCTWGGVILNIPPAVAKSVEDIISFIWTERKAGIAVIVSGILPLLENLWNKIKDQRSKYSYQNDFSEEPYSFKSPNHSSKAKQQRTKRPNKPKKNKIRATDNKYTKMTEESNGVWEAFSDESLSKNKPGTVHKTEECNDGTAADDDEDKITISDLNWEGQNELFEHAIQNILDKENITMFDVLQFSHFFFERVRSDVAEREELFQNALRQAPGLAEETVEKVFGVTGKRSQFFANEVMKTYKDIKLIAIKQDYQKMTEREGIQVPLYSTSSCPISLLFYKSSEKHGTKTQKFLKVLEKAQVTTSQADYTYYPSNNSCFLEFTDKNSKYEMAGVMNFGDDDEMMGIILLSIRS